MALPPSVSVSRAATSSDYEALASSEYLPDWVAGISIGAINAAIIAGNTPENRVKRLRSFWQEITAPTSLWPFALSGSAWQQKASALTALTFGQPGFFTPRTLRDWFSPGKLVSYYDTSALKRTPERCGVATRGGPATEVAQSPPRALMRGWVCASIRVVQIDEKGCRRERRAAPWPLRQQYCRSTPITEDPAPQKGPGRRGGLVRSEGSIELGW